MSHTRRTLAWATCLLGMVLLVMPLAPPGRLGWMPLLRDWSHFALFALMAWVLLRSLLRTPHPMPRAVLETTGILLLMAAGSEYLQTFTGRSTDVADFMRDAAGMVAGMAAVFFRRTRARVAHVTLAVMMLGLLLFSTRDLMRRALVVWQKGTAFPLLEDFENDAALQLWHLERQGAPQDLQVLTNVATTGHRLQLPIHADGLTSLHGDAMDKDWSGWSHLVFDSELSAADDVLLGVRIDNALEPRKRLNLEVTLKPGSSIAVVALPSSPEAQKVLQKTGQIVLYALDSGVDAVLRLDNLRLERR